MNEEDNASSWWWFLHYYAVQEGLADYRILAMRREFIRWFADAPISPATSIKLANWFYNIIHDPFGNP